MPQFHVEEMAGETVLARHVTRAADALSAVKAVTGGQISARTDHQRWFRVVDERNASVHEFGVEEPPLRTDFAK
ncbi:hypothetical protein [Mesorhizobium sp. WSM3864]|uniref:hypothetical protein n=1 Tax=Mesorhizobium sp. WSM3864 TaxID=2029404 RepID=UPI001140ADA9|nr:hypothetical protein [Mesorhizobium sp. WSM3864]